MNTHHKPFYSTLLVAMAFLSLQAVAMFMLFPGILKSVDAWSFFASGRPLPVITTPVSTAVIILLFACIAFDIWRSMEIGLGRHIFAIAWFALAILSVSYFALAPREALTEYSPSKKIIVVGENPDRIGISEALLYVGGISSVAADFKESELTTLFSERRYFPGNLYRFDLIRNNCTGNFSVQGRLSRASVSASTSGVLNWNVVDTFSVENATPAATLSGLTNQLSIQLSLDLDREGLSNLHDDFPENAESYDSYLQALNLYWEGSDKALSESIAILKHLIKRDPSFINARLTLADCYSQLYQRLWSPREGTLDSALVYLNSALENSDSKRASVYRTLGLYYQNLASSSIQRAQRISSLPEKTAIKAALLDSALTATDSAVANYSLSRKLAKNDMIPTNNLAITLLQRSTMFQLKKMTDSAVSNIIEARHLLKTLLDQNPFDPMTYSNLAYTFSSEYHASDPNSSRGLLDSAQSLLEASATYVSSTRQGSFIEFNLACISSLKGDTRSSHAHLLKALVSPSFNISAAMAGDEEAGIIPDSDLRNYWLSSDSRLEEIREAMTKGGLTPIATKPFAPSI